MTSREQGTGAVSDSGSNGIHREFTKYFYGADDMLRVTDRYIGPGPVNIGNDGTPGRRGVFEEYNYDALGRRVLLRSRRWNTCPHTSAECASYYQWTVWDGDQILVERRVGDPMITPAASPTERDWLGDVAYLHAGGIDMPAVVVRSGLQNQPDGTTVYPHLNWKGEFAEYTTTGGATMSSCQGASGCPAVDFVAGKTTVDGSRIGATEVGGVWLGSLVGGADASSLRYQRNRYYDPNSGRFTQQDPIGLAGGLNLYGFAGGDPVNFSDPFGLCPIEKDGIACAYVRAAQFGAAGLAGGLVYGAVVGTLVVPVVGTLTGGASVGLAAGAAGLLLGATIGLAEDAAGLGDVLERRAAVIIAAIAGLLAGEVKAATKIIGKIQQERVDDERRKKESEKERKRKSEKDKKGEGEPPPNSPNED